MLKKVVFSASVLVLTGGLALAQAPMTRDTPISRDTMSGRSVGLPTSTRWLASDIYKANVSDDSENKIGDVTDLVIDTNGNVTMAILGVGGFLGVGQKDVAIPFKDLKISSRNGKDWLAGQYDQG